MTEEMVCPNCKEEVEAGAIYCGNCGYKFPAQPQVNNFGQVYSKDTGSNSALPLTTAFAGNNVPSYAIPHSHHKQHWAAMALAFGILGIGASVLIPIVGVAFGITGVVLVTASYRVTHGRIKVVGLIVSIAAVAVGLGFWINAVEHDAKLTASEQTATSNGVATINVNTPCYSVTFNTVLNVNNSKGSCTINAYNGASFDDSSDVYKVVANQTSAITAADFESFSKQAIAQDIAKNLPNFKITAQALTSFAGSPAYYIQAYNQAASAAVIEETIFHNETNATDNFFDIVHAANGQSVNLNSLERSWRWNE